MIHTFSDIHPSAQIDQSSDVWAFTVIEKDVKIGKNCVIGSHCYIGAGSVIGDGVHLQTGVFLSRNALIEDFVFIGPHVVFTDDRHPRTGNKCYFAEPPIVRMNASIGAGAVILPGVEIGAGAMIGAGAVVTKNVTLGDLAYGVPAVSRKKTMGWRSEIH